MKINRSRDPRTSDEVRTAMNILRLDNPSSSRMLDHKERSKITSSSSLSFRSLMLSCGLSESKFDFNFSKVSNNGFKSLAVSLLKLPELSPLVTSSTTFAAISENPESAS